jgi:hypothetical protein
MGTTMDQWDFPRPLKVASRQGGVKDEQYVQVSEKLCIRTKR